MTPRTDVMSKRRPQIQSGDVFQLPRGMLWLVILVGVLGLIVSGVGVLLVGGGDPLVTETLRGGTAELYGDGLYGFDTVFQAANNRSTDLVTLLLGLPLLGLSLRWAWKGSLRGRLVLLGALGYFTYVSATYALGGVAYNEMFLAYVAFFSTSLFAFVLVFGSLLSVDLQPDRLPRRWPAVFMVVSGVATLAIWMIDPLAALVEGGPPRGLDTYTTLFTYAFDIAVIVPAAIAAGVMIWRRRVVGYVTAASLLVLEAFLMPIITIATIIQVQLGISFEPGQMIGPIAGFSLLAAFAIWVSVAVLRSVPKGARDTG